MAADPKRIAGTAYLTVNGKQLALKGEMMIRFSPTEREGIAGMDGVHGFSEKPIVPSISGKFSRVEGVDMEDIDAMTDVTVQVDGANGQPVAVGRNGWTKGNHELNMDTGDLTITWEFMKGEWQA